ncbi:MULTISPECIES: DUF7002 family protein [unclassified Sphingomonas]|uniref:DUF7002 family protein n=1 Tax=unclassified Sphingomonas TaxID=196159 RepID=UPI000AFF69B7|nr:MULTISPECIES: hypothetical protein [unclassified Sphingomonas]
MTEDELIERHPKVWHMAADGSWPSIRDHGLLSVTALLDLYGVTGGARAPIESARRPQCVTLKADGLPDAVVRDNKPMFEASLLKCLQNGLTPRDWYETLNRKSFLWVERERLERLLKAKAYAKDPQVVLTVDTKSLIERHRNAILLSAINSGQTLYVPQPRGTATFHPIAGFPSGAGRVGTTTKPRIVELTVEGGVPDIADMVLKVERVESGVWTSLEV